ncbi:MAG TPA: ribonuclease E/G, partial [Acidimicrobiales bacterium]|nr:ribonuclease E/G [Acidimicrobiales bacterium]
MTEPAPDGAPSTAPRADAAPVDPSASTTASTSTADTATTSAPTGGSGTGKRRRGSRGGRNRNRPAASGGTASGKATPPPAESSGASGSTAAEEPTAKRSRPARDRNPDELPERSIEGRPRTAEAADRALVRRPQIGDSRPAPVAEPAPKSPTKRRRGGRGRGSKAAPVTPVEAILGEPYELDEEAAKGRRGRERKGRPVGRYLMTVSVQPNATQIAVLEGRSLIEHYVSRPADDVSQIHGNIYLGRVQNVLPGMEAAFVDIGTPKNAVLYRGDVQYDAEDIEEKGSNPRIEHLLKAKQTIICQVTKNPIAHKGARLTQEVSIPGRFVVLIPNSTTYGISKRLADDERKRLRSILDRVRPKGHGIIVRTAAEGVSADEIERDVARLQEQWAQIETLAQKASAPALLYREPDMAVRVIREEFNQDYRGVIIDDRALYEEVRDYVAGISPTLADRVEHYDRETEPLPLYERHHVHEQLHKALDRKVWLPSGGSLIIEHTEAL